MAKYHFGKVRLKPVHPAVYLLAVHDLWGISQGTSMALVLHHTTRSVQLADLCGSFAAHASESLQILALYCYSKVYVLDINNRNIPNSQVARCMTPSKPSNNCLPSHLHFNTVLQGPAISNFFECRCQRRKASLLAEQGSSLPTSNSLRSVSAVSTWKAFLPSPLPSACLSPESCP